MPKLIRIFLPVLLALFFTSALWLFIHRAHPVSALTPDPTVADLAIPEFTLTTHDAKPITRAELLNHLTIVDFMFTNCPFVCPIMTDTMASVSRDLAPMPVRFLSISVDPAHDTPARLKTFAQLHNADLSRWTFATAAAQPNPQSTLDTIVTTGLHFALAPDPKTPINIQPAPADTASPADPTAPTTMFNITHPSWFVLVGPQAQVLGIYLSGDPDQMQALKTRVREAAAELQ